VDGSGILVIADRGNNRIRKVAEGGTRLFTLFGTLLGPPTITTIAGNGQADYLGDDGPATAARLRSPGTVVSDASGNLFIADTANHRVRRVDRVTGTIQTIAGMGHPGFDGDDGPAVAALINSPQGLALDGDGSLYIADTENHRIRRVSPDGKIVTIAGTVAFGYAGDNGPATAASLLFPTGLATDQQGNLYIVDTGNNRIRKVAASTGLITTVAGNGSARFANDGQLATEASLNGPRAVAFDAVGNFYIADSGNDRIRRVDFRTQIIQTVAGNGERRFSGDGGPAIAAALSFPLSVAIDRTGAVLILDSFNNRLRQLQPETGIIRTISGTGTPGFSGDNGLAKDATLWAPAHVTLDSRGNILIADTTNHRIRAISP
jgi:sugar lactone lactonase YvrE